jgi:hypothetical protein
MVLANLYAEFFLYGGPLLKMPRTATNEKLGLQPEADRLRQCFQYLRRFFDHTHRMSPTEFANFSAMEWIKFVLAVILCMRISFPILECPAWDDARARAELQFDGFLARMCEKNPGKGFASTDVSSASRIILELVRTKYQRRAAALQTAGASKAARAGGPRGCPMLDPAMEQYFPLWDPSLAIPNSSSAGTSVTTTSDTARDVPMLPVGGEQPVYHDLWSTMTVGWAGMDEEGDIESGNYMPS